MHSFASTARNMVLLGVIAAAAWSLPFQSAVAGDAPDLTPLRQWIGKTPFDTIGTHKLFDDKLFQEAFKKTAGDKIFKLFMSEYKQGGRYFQSDAIVEDDGLMRVYVQNLSGSPANSTMFINVEKGYMDICWNDLSDPKTNAPGLNAMLLHTGEKVKVKFLACQDVNYKAVTSKDFSEKLKREQAAFLGTWSGQFVVDLGQGNKVQVSRSVAIAGNPSEPDGLRYTHKENYKSLSGGTFNCTKKSEVEVVFEGAVNVDGATADFIQTKASPPDCLKLPPLRYTVQGNKLVHKFKNADTEVLTRQP